MPEPLPQFYQAPLRIWVCPDCGRSVSSSSGTCDPDTICRCQYPRHYTQMTRVLQPGQRSE